MSGLVNTLPAEGSMAAHDGLAAAYGVWLDAVSAVEIDEAWDALANHAANCGLPADEPDLPDRTERRLARYSDLMGFGCACGTPRPVAPFYPQNVIAQETPSWTRPRYLRLPPLPTSPSLIPASTPRPTT